MEDSTNPLEAENSETKDFVVEDPFFTIRDPMRNPVDRTLEPTIQTALGEKAYKRTKRALIFAQIWDGLLPRFDEVPDSQVYVGLSPIVIGSKKKKSLQKEFGYRRPLVIKNRRVHWLLPIGVLILGIVIFGVVYSFNQG